ncbi:MAG: DUF3187 family protein [Bdellovibrionota bacterium]
MRLIIILLFLSPLSAIAEDSPYLARNQYPLTMNRLTLRPESAAVVKKSDYSFSFISAWTNTAINQPNYTIDTETVSLSPVLDFGVTDSFTFGIEVPVQWRGGGSLDGFIDSWHDFFSLPVGDRPSLKDDTHSITGLQGSGESFNSKKEGWGVGSPILRAKYLFYKSESFKFSLLNEASLPAIDTTYGQESVDLGSGLIASYSAESFRLHGGTSAYYFFDEEVDSIQYEQWHYEGFVLGELDFTDVISAFLGMTATSDMLVDLPGHASYQSYLDMGFSFRFNSYSIDFAVREDLSAGDSSADVGFLLSFRAR